MSKHNGEPETELAVTRDRAQEQYFDEELQILRINMRRLFRQAIEIEADISILDMPEIGEQDELDEARTELDEARDGKDSVTHEIEKWREELAVASG